MKLLQLVTAPQRRGAEVFALDLARALEERGVTTTTAYLYPSGDRVALALRPQDVALGGRRDHPFERFPAFHPLVLARLLRCLQTFRPDIVQTAGSRSVKYAALARRLHPGPWRLVYRAIGDPRVWRQPGLRTSLYRAAVLRAFDAFIAVSGQALEALETGGRAAVQIPRGIDVERFRPTASREEVRRRLGTERDAPVLIYVGRLSPEKRIDRLLRVAAAVARRVAGTELWVVGEGPDRRLVQAAVATAPLKVQLLGVRGDVADLMASADLLLLTSDTEGIPGVVLEAAAVGLPAVATRVGGVAECVSDGETGVLVEPQDEDSMAGAASELLEDGGRRREMGAASRLRAHAEFSLQGVADRYLSFYQSLLGRAPSIDSR